MNTMSAVVMTSAADGGGSKVWEFVPSGTMPTISARSPMMFAAIEVIGATVVTTWRSVVTPVAVPDVAGSPLESSLPHAASSDQRHGRRAAAAVSRDEEADGFRNIDATLVATSSQQDVVLDIRRHSRSGSFCHRQFEAQRASTRRLEYGPCDAARLLE